MDTNLHCSALEKSLVIFSTFQPFLNQLNQLPKLRDQLKPDKIINKLIHIIELQKGL